MTKPIDILKIRLRADAADVGTASRADLFACIYEIDRLRADVAEAQAQRDAAIANRRAMADAYEAVIATLRADVAALRLAREDTSK